MKVSEFLKDGRQITVLAGAGLSAPPPTCLPGWWALNDAVLGALGTAIEQIANSRGLSDGFRAAIRQRRDSTPFLMPDLQAQLLEDELGPTYFRALSVLDSGEPNAAHHLLVAMARQGRLAAVLTTNFDCTIERAFDTAAVAYRLYASPADFERLDDAAAPIPVVKIHGSADRPDTMVDTLRQRLQGRPASLEQWMRQHFARYPTVGVGFSCEDLQYDPDYLAIRPAVRGGARFLFLVREGTTPSVPLQRLAADFPRQVSTSEGELPGWLFDVASTLDATYGVPAPVRFTEEDIARRRAEAARKLDEALAAWAASLGPMAAVNAVTSLLAAAGHRHDADHLLRRMWKFYRAPEDCTGPAYARYLHNYGENLLRQGRLHNPHDRVHDFLAWKGAADRDPRQFFARAVSLGGGENSRARSLLCEFLAGSDVPSLSGPAIELLETINTARGNEGSLRSTLIDASFSLAELLELLSLGQAAPRLLEDAHRSAVALGDEFRRAEAAWRLARNLSFGLDQDAAAQTRVAGLAAECCEIAARLNIREADAGAALARATAAIARSDWAAAIEQSHKAETIYREIENLPGEIFAKRERVRALVGEGMEAGTMETAPFDELSEALQRFAIENAPGLRPLVKYELANLARYFDDQLARDLASDATQDAKLTKHPWLATAAAELLNALSAPMQ